MNNKQIQNNLQNTKTGKRPYIIGLCGGIGSGKSAAAQILNGFGAYIIDTDKISKDVTIDGSECNSRLKAAFPQCVVDGVLQKNLLKNLVFSEDSARALLNSITHPYILAETMRQTENKDIVVIQVPLLFESGFDKLCDMTACVVADAEKRVERVIKRDGITSRLAVAIMSSQLSDEELVGRCDFVIDNSGNKALLEANVEEFFREVKKRL